MRIAICLSGMPRNIQNSYQWLKESVLDVLDANNLSWDIFVRMWGKNDDEDILELLKTYKPIVVEFEEWNTKNDETTSKLGWEIFKEHKFEIEPRASCLGQFYNIFQCNNLKNKYELFASERYDICIRIRTELKFNNPLDIKELEIINNCSQPIIFLRQGPNPNHIHWYKDNFAIGNKKGMDIYADCINHLLQVSKLTRVSTAELILRNWLDLNKNLLVKHTNLDYTLTRQ